MSNKPPLIKEFENNMLRDDLPNYSVGDTISVKVRVIEGTADKIKERIQNYEGVIIAKKNRGLNSAITVRKISHGVGVERIFQVHSKLIESISIKRRGDVKKAKLYYLRQRSGKSARIKEKIV